MASSPAGDDHKRTRKCRTCQRPMKGHKAETCFPATEVTLPATPPASPPNAIIGNGIRNRTRDIEIPMERHWRNPSWTPRATTMPPPVPSNATSLVPTVLVDEDGNTIRGSNDIARSESGDDSEAGPGGIQTYNSDSRNLRLKTPMAQVMDQAHALRLCDPVMSIVKVSLKDLPRMQATAGQSGLCTSIVRAPWTSPRFKDEFEPSLNWDEEKNVWVVIGSDPTLVQRTADLQQKGEQMPGSMKDDIVVVQATYKHIIVASVVSSVVVLGMVALFV
ncbi:hypothetical protein B0H10DRAFT_2040434 [Mycena sp. CBHHK59/15]|nr:hypothetical protein B0H10DRAFT_2040434 [Mycena sp. CBHHK59/15]